MQPGEKISFNKSGQDYTGIITAIHAHGVTVDCSIRGPIYVDKAELNGTHPQTTGIQASWDVAFAKVRPS